MHDAAADRQRWRARVVQIHPPERPQYRPAVAEITPVGVFVCPGCGRWALSAGGQVHGPRMTAVPMWVRVAW